MPASARIAWVSARPVVPANEAAPHVTAWHGALEAVNGTTCLLHTRSDSLHFLAYRVSMLPLDYTLLDPPELAEPLAAIADRATRAISSFTTG
ncbi:hypothetical protein [Actinomadura meridiana]|uniref:hypothetical protein n=1 Tax=Actinomadura meridiana TaxID=559626 RepID=UPI0031E6AD5F